MLLFILLRIHSRVAARGASVHNDVDSRVTVLCGSVGRRPNIAQLCQIPFVRSCLSLCKSPLVDTQAHRASLLTKEKPVTTKAIPDSVPELNAFLKTHASRVGCIVAGLEQMTTFFTGEDTHTIDDDGKKFIVQLLLGNKQNTWVQTAGIQALHAISLHCTSKDDVLYSKEFVEPVLTAMQYHPSAEDLQEAALKLMVSLAEVDNCCDTIVKEGGIEQIQSILTKMEIEESMVRR